MAAKNNRQGGAKSTYGGSAQAVTANRLSDGVVVYLTPDGDWSERVADAAWATDKTDQQALLARAEGDARVVGPYLFAVDLDRQGRPYATSNREIIRSHGPSIRTDLGKQAELEG